MPAQRTATTQVRRAAGQQGFTTSELVLVLGVLAVLITIVVVSVSGIERGTTERDCRSELRQLKASVEEYKVTLGAYPPDDAALEAFNVLDASAHPNYTVSVDADGRPAVTPVGSTCA